MTANNDRYGSSLASRQTFLGLFALYVVYIIIDVVIMCLMKSALKSAGSLQNGIKFVDMAHFSIYY